MLGKQAIATFFMDRDIRHVFTVPGIHTLPLDETFVKLDIQVFVGRHESNVAFMGTGYAKATGRVGVVIVTPGPGLGNVVSGCLEAFGNDLPLLIIHVDTERSDVGKGILHELVEPERIFTHITKKTFFVEGPQTLVPSLDAAYQTALSGRPGPVLISIPHTLFEREVPFHLGAPSDVAMPQTSALDLSSVEHALEGKERPVILGGWALMMEEVRPMLEDACMRASIPFLTSTGGKGALREDQLITFGTMQRKSVMKDILASADLVIALGTRLREMDSKRRGLKISELIHIDVDARWMDRNYPARLKMAGNIGPSTEALCQILTKKRSMWDLPALKELQRKEEAELRKTAPGFKIIDLLRSVIPDDTLTVWDPILPAYWANNYFPVFHQRTFIAPTGCQTIFYAVPASIGAKIGRPDRPCLCIAGDGSALPTLAELATVRKYAIPIVFLIYNNNSFGLLEETMEGRYAIKGSMDLTNPDFVQLARSFGIKASLAGDLEQLRQIFLHDVTWNEPFLIEFKYPLFAPPWEI